MNKCFLILFFPVCFLFRRTKAGSRFEYFSAIRACVRGERSFRKKEEEEIK